LRSHHSFNFFAMGQSNWLIGNKKSYTQFYLCKGILRSYLITTNPILYFEDLYNLLLMDKVF
jgi:hypothetical protein